MAEILLTLAAPAVESALEKLASLATREFFAVFDAEEDIENLSSRLRNIKELLNHLAASNEMDFSSPPTLGNWLEDLQVAALDAEDLIESWATEYKLWSMKKKVQKFHIPFAPFNLLFLRRESHKLRNITQRIEKLLKDGEAYRIIMGNRPNEIKALPETGPSPGQNLVSREEDKNKIIEMLIPGEGGGDGGDLSFVPILGMGGLGKTTLAQLVCDDRRVKTYFNGGEAIIWVCVTKVFNLESIFRSIVVSQNSKNSTDSSDNFLPLPQLEQRACKTLNGKRFLLVLDDLWDHKPEVLDRLVNTLAVGGKGSKVLVTSRIREVSNIRGSKPPYYLGCLGEIASWELFSNFAFRNDRDYVRESDFEEFEKYGREIIRKCQGLPLALKQMGALLLEKDLEFWEGIARSQTWTHTDGAMAALRLSYNHLPSPFHKLCFAYCSLFPKAYVYEKHELVKLWMAEAIIQPANHERKEATGSRYFKELSDRFFFEPIHEGSTNEEGAGTSKAEVTKYKMHDLIHDLAQLISSPFCYQLVKDAGDFNAKARHISLLCNDVDQPTLEILRSTKKLRTVLLPGQQFKAFGKVQSELFHSLKYVRLLDLSSSTPLTQLPDSIGKLKLLRYLDLSTTEIEKLPDSICILYNLETLKLLGCRNLVFELPRNFKNLVNLRHLELDNMFWFKASTLPPGMGCLTSLHNLHKFQIGCKTGYKLEELRGMDYLTGTLHITQLENAVNAGEANLKGKKMIQKVVYEWTNSDLNMQDAATENKVLEDLEPHPRVLEELQICHYRGTEFPIWIQEGRLRNLVSVYFSHCTKIKTLSLGDLPNLREVRLKSMLELEEWQGDTGTASLIRLNITDCPKLKILPPIFLNLRLLKIKECESLEIVPFGPIMFLTLVDNLVLKHWPEDYIEGSTAGLDGLIGFFTGEMINVKIVNCPELHSLPRSLYPQKLEIRGCKSVSALPDENHAVRLTLLALEGCHDDERISNLMVGRVPSPSTLLSLEISNISNIICLPKWPRLSSVRNLYIRGCKDLEHLSTEGNMVFEGFTSLTLLSIRKCPKLVTLPVQGLPTSLIDFSIASCERLESFGLPDALKKLSCLTDLYIEDCPALQSLPEDGLPTSLQHLSIQRCPSLIEQCAKEDGDRPKIKDIPDLEIEMPPAETSASSSLAWYGLPGCCTAGGK